MRKVSVIVPIYNVGPYLDRCIESIVNQSYNNLEIILIDDGSSDNSPDICEKWAAIDNRIKVCHKKNGGLSDARNTGVNMAIGDFVSFVDADDSIHKLMIETMITGLSNYHCDIACCGKLKISNNKKERTQFLHTQKVYTPSEAIDELFFGYYIDESFCDKLFKIELLKKHPFTVGEINEDLPILPSIFNECKGVLHVGHSFYNYHQNIGSITRSGYYPKMRVIIKHLNELDERYGEQHRKAINILKTRYSVAMLCRINNETRKETYIQDDKKYYTKILSENICLFCMTNRVKFKEKILAVLVWMHLIRVVTRLVKLRKMKQESV